MPQWELRSKAVWYFPFLSLADAFHPPPEDKQQQKMANCGSDTFSLLKENETVCFGYFEQKAPVILSFCCVFISVPL